MKLSDVKERIDVYFESVTPKEIVCRLEVLGFEFSPCTADTWQVYVEHEADDNVHRVEPQILPTINFVEMVKRGDKK